MKTRVALADDHLMFRQALRVMLESQADIQVVAEASNGNELLRIASEVDFDVAFMDVSMPLMNGTEATRRLLAQRPNVKVIGVSAFADRNFVLDLIKAGAAGYVTKTEAGDELLRAIKAVSLNRKYLSDDVADIVTSALVHTSEDKTASVRLGPRERQVLQLVAEGYTSVQIAERLHIAPSTSEVHRRNIMRKLNLHSVAELTKYAVRNGLTTV